MPVLLLGVTPLSVTQEAKHGVSNARELHKEKVVHLYDGTSNGLGFKVNFSVGPPKLLPAISLLDLERSAAPRNRSRKPLLHCVVFFGYGIELPHVENSR